MTKLFLSLDDAVRVAVREFDLGDFIEFGKKAFGVELTFKKSDNPDTYEKLFGISQEAKTGYWIPVSEKFPEYGEAVLTINTHGDYEINHIVYEDRHEWLWDDNVVAWMPLPEFYKPQESENA